MTLYITDYKITFKSQLLVFISLAICLIIIFAKTESKLKGDLLEPPRLLALLYLISFPIMGIIQSWFPSTSKVYLYNINIYNDSLIISKTSLYIILSLPIFYYGYKFGFRSFPKYPFTIISNKEKNNYRKIFFWSIILLIFGLLNLILYIRDVGGLNYLIATMKIRTLWEKNTIINYSSEFLLISPVLIVSINYFLNKSKLKKYFSLLTLILSLILLLLKGTRGILIIGSAVTLIIIYYFSWSNKGIRPNLRNILSQILIFSLIILVFFIGILSIRFSGIEMKSVSVERIVRDFDPISINIWAFEFYLKKNDLILGRSIIAPILYPYFKFFVYNSAGNALKLFLPLEFQTTPALLALDINPYWENSPRFSHGISLAGEMYINFWWFGYLVFFITGFFFGKFRMYLEITGFKFWDTIIYSFLLFWFSFFICIKKGLSESIIPIAISIVQILSVKLLSNIKVTRNLPGWK